MKLSTLARKAGTVWLIGGLSIAQLVVLPSAVLAVGPTKPTGAQGLTGVQGPTGPQSPTGVQGPVGAQDTGTLPVDEPQLETPQSAAQVSDPAIANGQSPADTSLTNDLTGSNSDNSNVQNSTSDTTVDQNNTADLSNNVNLDANSGANTISQNTSGGNISTGDLQGSIDIINVANSNFAPGSSVGVQSLNGGSGDLYLLASDGRTLLPSNDTTGANSSNANTVNGTNVVHFITTNTADIGNDVNLFADTGKNSVTENTSLGDFMTGSIDMALNLVNLINLQLPNLLLNLDIWSIFGDQTGDLVMPTNSNTGSNSSNTNTVNTTNVANLGITQNADIANNFDIATNTGGNQLDSNSVVGNVETGSVNVKGGVTNIANSGQPILYLINVMGKWLGEAIMPGVGVMVSELGNVDTGANSDNSNTVNQVNVADTTLNQNANVGNNIKMDLNTGNNTVARNTKVGNIQTGSIDVMANIVNFVNSFGGNLSNFSLGIVNIFGNWFGSVKSPTAAATASAQSSGSAPLSATAGAQSQSTPQLNNSNTTTSSTAAPSTQGVLAATVSPTVSSNANASSGSSSVAAVANVNESATQIASATVLGATQSLATSPVVAGTTSHRTSSLPWIAVGVALLLGWIFIEVMAARATRDKVTTN